MQLDSVCESYRESIKAETVKQASLSTYGAGRHAGQKECWPWWMTLLAEPARTTLHSTRELYAASDPARSGVF